MKEKGYIPGDEKFDEIFRQKMEGFREDPSDGLWDKISDKLPQPIPAGGIRLLRPYLPYAAAVTILAVAGFAFASVFMKPGIEQKYVATEVKQADKTYYKQTTDQSDTGSSDSNDIHPAGFFSYRAASLSPSLAQSGDIPDFLKPGNDREGSNNGSGNRKDGLADSRNKKDNKPDKNTPGQNENNDQDNNNYSIEPDSNTPLYTDQPVYDNREPYSNETRKEKDDPRVITDSNDQSRDKRLDETEVQAATEKYPAFPDSDNNVQIQDNDELKFPNVITPNADGINDYFVILNLESFPDNTLIVSDRNGNIIFSVNGYRNDWDARNVTDGTYYFVFLYKTDDRKDKVVRGMLYIKRD